MFILKETENSDLRCGSDIATFETLAEAQDKMRGEYQKTVDIMGGNFETEESGDCSPDNQRWATISAMAAHIQNCMDAYDWEIMEDPNWVKKQQNGSGVYDSNSRELMLGDKVVLLDRFCGTIVFESGCYGVGFDSQNSIDWEYLKRQIEPVTGCRNAPAFCYNDNFVSLWELLWNFGGIEHENDVCAVLKIVEEG